MPTALPLSAALVAGSENEADAKLWLAAERAALAEIGDPMGRPGAIQNLSLVFTVASNALTCNVKTRAGAAPSATDPVSAAMRNATLASGDFNVRNITAALSLVISSGSTLGHLSATASQTYWYLIDNAGALELAVSSTYFGQKGIVTTVAEGGAGAADSATVMYSATARTNVPFLCIGRTTDTQTTAGTWAAVPSTSELSPFDQPISPIAGNLVVAGSLQVGTGTVGFGTIVKRKTADESVTSSTTLQNDDHLTFAIGANEEWIADFDICWSDAAAGGVNVAITTPAGATNRFAATLLDNVPATSPSCLASLGTTSGSTFLSTSTAGTVGTLRIAAWVLNGATPGNVTLQFAQSNSNGTATTFLKGSHMVANRVA